MTRLFIILLSFCMIAMPVQAQVVQKSANFVTSEGTDAGTARLEETPGGVIIHLDLKNIPAGEHAFHIHEKGDCSPAGVFTNAGGHFNPGGHMHGYKVEGGIHAGDLPNITVSGDRVYKGELFNDRVTLRADAQDGRAVLLDTDGAALVVHMAADDYMSQPSGAAGDRLACAVIE